MITRLTDVPQNLVAFRATGEVTKDDYETVFFPSVKKLLQNTDRLNYLTTIETPLKNFTACTWRERYVAWPERNCEVALCRHPHPFSYTK